MFAISRIEQKAIGANSSESPTDMPTLQSMFGVVSLIKSAHCAINENGNRARLLAILANPRASSADWKTPPMAR